MSYSIVTKCLSVVDYVLSTYKGTDDLETKRWIVSYEFLIYIWWKFIEDGYHEFEIRYLYTLGLSGCVCAYSVSFS